MINRIGDSFGVRRVWITMTQQDSWRLFVGEANSTLARVFVEYQGLYDAAMNIEGRLRGPHCRHARTLVSTVLFRRRVEGDRLLAEAVLPDPCFWTPDQPYLYQVEAELRRDGHLVDSFTQPLAIRRLVVRGPDLWWEGRRWVMRAAGVENLESVDLSQARELGLALVVESPNDMFCRQASEVGVLLVAVVPRDSVDPIAEQRRLAGHAAVGIVVYMDDTRVPPRRDGNLRGCLVGPGESEIPDCDVALVTARSEAATVLQQSQIPVLVVANNETGETADELRRQCDKIQRRLAPVGQFAGYLVAPMLLE